MYDILKSQPEPGVTNPPPPKQEKHIDPKEFTDSAYNTVQKKLSQEPEGTAAIVGVDWDIPGTSREISGGHWFNAYVEENGKIRWADEQMGAVGDWPPKYGYNIWNVDVMIRHSIDSKWKGLDLGTE